MKTKLLKTLAISGVALTLGVATLTSCGGGYRTADIAEIVAWEEDSKTETDYLVCEGDAVVLKNVVISAFYSATEFSIQTIPPTDSSPINAIEVHSKAAVKGTYDLKDIVNVRGIVAVDPERGCAILTEASVSWGTGGESKCKGKGALYYYGNEYLERTSLTDPQQFPYYGIEYSGLLIELSLTIQEKPEDFTQGVENKLILGFPGEDYTLNEYAVYEVVLPAYDATDFETVSTWLDALEVGDTVALFHQQYYLGDSATFGQTIGGILSASLFRFKDVQLEVEIDGLYDEWGDVDTFDTVANRCTDVSTIVNDLSLQHECIYGWRVYEPKWNAGYGGYMIIGFLSYDPDAEIFENERVYNHYLEYLTAYSEGLADDEPYYSIKQYLDGYVLTWNDYVNGAHTATGSTITVITDNPDYITIQYLVDQTKHNARKQTFDQATNPASAKAAELVTDHLVSQYGYYGCIAEADLATYEANLLTPENRTNLASWTFNTTQSRTLGTKSDLHLYQIDFTYTGVEKEDAKALADGLEAQYVASSEWELVNTTAFSTPNYTTGVKKAYYNAESSILCYVKYSYLGGNDKATTVSLYACYVNAANVNDYISAIE